MKLFRKIFYSTAALVLCALLPLATACKGVNANYVDYVSEYRGDIFLAETDEFLLTAFFSTREYPYHADGVCAQKQDLAEIYLAVPDNSAGYEISFSVNGKDYGGEMSYDNVYARFSFSQSVPLPEESAIAFTVTSNGGQTTLDAKSVKGGNELTMSALIEKLTEQKKTYFDSLTESGVFYGEIYVRLVFEEKSYYFIRVTEVGGKSAYFLLDGETGNLLAEKMGNESSADGNSATP